MARNYGTDPAQPDVHKDPESILERDEMRHNFPEWMGTIADPWVRS